MSFTKTKGNYGLHQKYFVWIIHHLGEQLKVTSTRWQSSSLRSLSDQSHTTLKISPLEVGSNAYDIYYKGMFLPPNVIHYKSPELCIIYSKQLNSGLDIPPNRQWLALTPMNRLSVYSYLTRYPDGDARCCQVFTESLSGKETIHCLWRASNPFSYPEKTPWIIKEREGAGKRRHNNTVIMMGNQLPPPKMGRGTQNVFTLGHIKLDHDAKKTPNLQWNRPNTFSEVAWTNPLTDDRLNRIWRRLWTSPSQIIITKNQGSITWSF